MLNSALVKARLCRAVEAARAHPLAAGLLIALNLAALGILIATESRWETRLAFLLGWGFFAFGWMVLLARPVISSAVTLGFLVLLLLLSRFKHDILLMTVNFVDLMLIDTDTFAFLMMIFPQLGLRAAVGTALVVFTLAVIWRLDVLRIRRTVAGAASAACLTGLVALSLAVPTDPWEEFYAENYFSKYARSAVTAVGDLITRGILDSSAKADAQLPAAVPCVPQKPPHIIMIHDESSFDARAIPGIKVPPGYGDYFKSSDGKSRTLLVEGPGGPSWYTEYNVVTGLSARSFGRFVDFVTRIAAGRVERGLPRTLRNCGFNTFTLYPMYGSFLSAERFQTTAGTENFLDSRALGAAFQDTDGFYFNAAADVINRERGKGRPLYLHVYTAQNHFPWTFRFRPDLAADWKAPGNTPDVDEYLRRQHMTEVDYKAFIERLKRDFPDESFLIVRFGDHQPYFARSLIDPGQDDSVLVRRIAAGDPRFLRTYYAIDTINFTPRDVTNAIDNLDAPYLPLIILEAAGIPLDPSFSEQKRILVRCKGLFFRCSNGAEARRFNRLLIDAGLIKGL